MADTFDPTPFITMIDDFPKRELIEVLRAHNCEQGDRKVATLKTKAIALLKDSTKGEAASVTVLHYKQNVLCPFNVKKIDEEETKQHIISIAQRITDELDVENVTAKFDDQSRMIAPPTNLYFCFEENFAITCNNKLNATNRKKACSTGWHELSKDSQQKWRNYHLKLVELYDGYLCDGKEIAVVEKKLLNGDIKIVYRCCFCFNKQVRTSEQHKHIRKIHFPDWQTESDVKVQYEAAIKSMKEDPLAIEFHAKVLSVWQSLWSGRMSTEHAKLVKKTERLYNSLIKVDNDKNTVVYILTQLCEGYELIENCDLPATSFRYTGKHLIKYNIRHFDSTGKAKGNVAREITKLIQKYLSRNNSEIQQSERLYGWHALKCPAKSIEVFEMSIIMAMWHLTENDPKKYWNMQLKAIPEKKSLRNHNPEELVILGLYSLKQIISEFKKQTQIGEKAFFKSPELLSIYDAFNEQDRASFNARYNIAESAVAQVNALKEINAELLSELRTAAKLLNSNELLETCRHLEALTIKALGTQVENTEDLDDTEMADDE